MANGKDDEIFLFPVKNFSIFLFGKKSSTIFPFFQYKDVVKISGPEHPLCANKSEPSKVLSSTKAFAGSETPDKFLNQNCSFCTVNPTSAGSNFLIVCPNFCAISKAIELAPKRGKDNPPLATTSFFASIIFESVFIL